MYTLAYDCSEVGIDIENKDDIGESTSSRRYLTVTVPLSSDMISELFPCMYLLFSTLIASVPSNLRFSTFTISLDISVVIVGIISSALVRLIL